MNTWCGCHPRCRKRLSPSRRFNSVLYQIALTQAHHSDQARAYLDRRVREGKSRREAMRALKRFIVRAIWRLWQECEPSQIMVSVEVAA